MSESKLFQNDRPQGSTLGVSSGTGGGHTPGPKPASIPCAERDNLCSQGAPRPNGFTGVWGGVHYYKGHRWEGDTNKVGCKPLQAICLTANYWAICQRKS